MKKVKMNKKFKSIYESYLESEAYFLYDVYNSYSKDKERAWEYCQQLYHDYNGRGFAIISHNCNKFSVGFECVDDNGVLNFVYITKDYDRIMEVTL